jgi:hypothetical protein
MIDVSMLFEQLRARPKATSSELWNNRDALDQWLAELFPAILQMDWHAKPANLEIPPYRLPYNPTYLLSHDLMSALSHRPPEALVTRQDFERAFCAAFLDFICDKEETTPLEPVERREYDGQATHTTRNFLYWLTGAMYRQALGEDGEFLHYVTPGGLCIYLFHQARSDPIVRKHSMIDRVALIPLLISVLFAVHRSALWAQLRDSLDRGAIRELKLPFGLMELFLNRWAAEDLRLLTVTEELVTDLFRYHSERAHVSEDLRPKRSQIMSALRLSSKIINLEKPTFSSPAGKLVTRASSTALELGGAAYQQPDLEKYVPSVDLNANLPVLEDIHGV